MAPDWQNTLPTALVQRARYPRGMRILVPALMSLPALALAACGSTDSTDPTEAFGAVETTDPTEATDAVETMDAVEPAELPEIRYYVIADT